MQPGPTPTPAPSTPTTSITGGPTLDDGNRSYYTTPPKSYGDYNGSTYTPGAGNNVVASPTDIQSQANRWEDWAIRMAEINAQISAAASSSNEFGMVTLPSTSYAVTQSSSEDWSDQATQQFTDFADALNGTADDYVATELDNANRASYIAE